MATITIAEIEGHKSITVTSIDNAVGGDTTVALPSNCTDIMVKIVGTIIREDAHFNGSVYEEHSGTHTVTVIVPYTRIRSIYDITTA